VAKNAPDSGILHPRCARIDAGYVNAVTAASPITPDIDDPRPQNSAAIREALEILSSWSLLLRSEVRPQHVMENVCAVRGAVCHEEFSRRSSLMIDRESFRGDYGTVPGINHVEQPIKLFVLFVCYYMPTDVRLRRRLPVCIGNANYQPKEPHRIFPKVLNPRLGSDPFIGLHCLRLHKPGSLDWNLLEQPSTSRIPTFNHVAAWSYCPY
jgi:hypothetical protein